MSIPNKTTTTENLPGRRACDFQVHLKVPSLKIWERACGSIDSQVAEFRAEEAEGRFNFSKIYSSNPCHHRH